MTEKEKSEARQKFEYDLLKRIREKWKDPQEAVRIRKAYASIIMACGNCTTIVPEAKFAMEMALDTLNFCEIVENTPTTSNDTQTTGQNLSSNN